MVKQHLQFYKSFWTVQNYFCKKLKSSIHPLTRNFFIAQNEAVLVESNKGDWEQERILRILDPPIYFETVRLNISYGNTSTPKSWLFDSQFIVSYSFQRTVKNTSAFFNILHWCMRRGQLFSTRPRSWTMYGISYKYSRVYFLLSRSLWR